MHKQPSDNKSVNCVMCEMESNVQNIYSQQNNLAGMEQAGCQDSTQVI